MAKRIAVCMLLAALALLVAGNEAAVTCGEVNSSLGQCLKYLTGDVEAPPAACCAGVTHITEICKTTEDKRTACGCVKAAAASIHNIKVDAASALPTKCGQALPIPISPDTDCSQIS